MTIDTDKLVSILKSDYPVSLTSVVQNDKTKLLVLFVLPEHFDEVESLAQKLMDDHDKKKGG